MSEGQPTTSMLRSPLGREDVIHANSSPTSITKAACRGGGGGGGGGGARRECVFMTCRSHLASEMELTLF